MKILVVLLCLFTFNGCEKKPSHSKENHEDTINIAVSSDYPPYIYKKDGKLVGFEIELIQAVADSLKKTVHFHDIDFHGIIKTVSKKQVDAAISSVAITPEREKLVNFSAPYHRSMSVLVVPLATSIHSLEDLNGKIVGVEEGTIYEDDIKKKKIKNITLMVKKKFPELQEAMREKKCEALVTGYSEAHEMQSNDPSLIIIPIDGTTITFSIIVPKNSKLLEPINKKLNEMAESGELRQLETKFFKDFIKH